MHTTLDPILVTQLGLVTREQALSHGLTRHQIAHLVTSGLLVRVHRGVYRDPAAPIVLDQHRLAAVLSCGGDASLSHRTAADHWGARGFHCAMLELSWSGQSGCRRPGVTLHRANHERETTRERGVPCTTRAQTIADLMVVTPPRVVARIAEQWIANRQMALADLTPFANRPGSSGARLRAMLRDRDLVGVEPDSVPEGQLAELFVRGGLAMPEHHHLVTVSSGATFELDWSYPHLRIAFEVDGYGVHLVSMETFANDRFRRNDLEIEGWTILNFAAASIRRSRRRVLDQIRRAVAVASVNAGAGAGAGALASAGALGPFTAAQKHVHL